MYLFSVLEAPIPSPSLRIDTAGEFHVLLHLGYFLPRRRPPFLVCPKGFKPPILGDF